MHAFRVAQRLFNTPLFLHPEKADAIMWALRERLGESFMLPDSAETPSEETIEASAFVGSRRRADGSVGLSRATTSGTAIIRVVGSLVNRGAWLDANSGLTSYEGIKAQVQEAANDPAIKAIVLDIDSPGGEATGMFSLATAIQAAREKKPVISVVDDMAASAAYGIASSGTEVVVSPTSMVGSIGVLYMHLDRSGEMQKQGVKPTLIYAGAHKVDGNPFGPLADDVRAALEKMVMQFYDQFLGVVAAGRPATMSVPVGRATEARVYLGQDAIAAGLADRIGTLDEVISSMASRPASAARKGGLSMTTTPNATAAGENTVSLEAHVKAIADAKAEATAAAQAVAATQITAAAAEAKTAERSRIMGILTCDEAKGKAATALALAGKEMDLVTAKDVLATVQTGAGGLEARMTERGDSPLGAGGNIAPMPEAAVASGWKKAVAHANKRFEGVGGV